MYYLLCVRRVVIGHCLEILCLVAINLSVGTVKEVYMSERSGNTNADKLQSNAVSVSGSSEKAGANTWREKKNME